MNAKSITKLVVMLGICLGMSIQGCEAETSSNVSGRKMKKDYPIEPVSFTDVKVADVFWLPRIETNRKVSIPYAFGKCAETGRIDNFAIAGGLMKGEHRANYPFDDTDPYKILEGAAYSLSVHPDPKLEKYLDELIVKIAAAQEDDGYLFTCRTNNAKKLINWFGKERWSKLGGSHELYNMGHLYEAAVAHYQATGKRTLLNVAIKNADFLDTVFGPGKNETAPGHQIIEMGLARLYRATGNEKYLKLAKFYLDTRGPDGNAYRQAHQRVVEQSEAVGHAVRASYMYCGMADVAALTGDHSYVNAIDRIWNNVVTKKLYLTGGIGARGSGEAFGNNYELPNASAYCETCAAIGNVMWNHRMFLFGGDAKYIDVLERTLYNALISGVSLSGDSFFYPNPLESRGQHKRSPWFGCACCPGNITRFMASVPRYAYAQAGDKLYVNLFVGGSATVRMKNNTVRIKQRTRYPWDGAVKMTVEPGRSAKFTICIRIPGWARNQPVPSDLYRYMSPVRSKTATSNGVNSSDEKVTLKVNGRVFALKLEKGFARIRRRWRKGDVVELNLPMPVRRVLSHEKVAENTGKVALQRGPIVYCAEWPDNNGHVLNVVLTDNARLTTEHRKDMLNGITVIRAKAVALSYGKDEKSVLKKQQDFVAIPYYAWAHRGTGEMAVWLARDESAAQPVTSPGAIRNPSFEEAVNNKPTGWETRTYGGKGVFKSVFSLGYAEGGHTGKRCVMIASESGGDLGWLTSVPIKPRSQYRLSGWIKTENLAAGSGKGALLNLHNIQPLQTPAVTGTKNWTRVELVFDSGDHSVVEINCLFGGWGLSTGKALFDDLRLELLSAKTMKPAVKIDASKIGEPVSKYIYGQFIEHLGRCIYGGIWAEMLEDRKFFYPVGAKQSPWKIVGDKAAVKMDKDNPFVGEHILCIRVDRQQPRGIVQGELALRKGKRYEGYIILAGDSSARVGVSLHLGTAAEKRQGITIDSLGEQYTRTPFSFVFGGDSDEGKLEIVGLGSGTFRVGAVSLMPADNINGMRADTLKLLKELNSPVYRWPGGNFVSGYNWKDGIGERDKRPPRKNPAWKGIEHNDFGLDEFIMFCREVGAEPMIAVNSGLGDDRSAAEEVEYANGPADTPMGKWRAANGHRQPYNVKWWCIGNEMYGKWQLGYMSLSQYVRKHNLFAELMRKVDPSIKLIAVGAVGPWSESMMKNCAEHMDLISEHFYRGAKESVMEHVRQAPDAVRGKVTAHRDYRKRFESLKGKDIRIAIDEWNYWYGKHIFGELGTRYFLRDALGIAAGLHEMIRSSDIVFMANYAQTVNVIGAIKTTKTAAAFETTGLALKLYRQRFGTLPAAITGDAYPLDVVAAWTKDRKALTVAIVNPTENELELPMELKGARLTGGGRLWLIAHSDPMAYNEPGKPPEVVIEEKLLHGISNKLNVPPLSICLYELPVR